MGWRKETYQDVRFFHRAILLFSNMPQLLADNCMQDWWQTLRRYERSIFVNETGFTLWRMNFKCFSKYWPLTQHTKQNSSWQAEYSAEESLYVRSLTHCCTWPARAVATSTTSDPVPMTTASRLCTRDPLPPVVSRSSLAGQVDTSSRGQGICPARGWQSWRMLWVSTSGGRRQCVVPLENYHLVRCNFCGFKKFCD